MSGDDVRDLIDAIGKLYDETLDAGLAAIGERRASHWLIFNDSQGVAGCHCGFTADIDADCGFGDSVVEHLIDVGRDELQARREGRS